MKHDLITRWLHAAIAVAITFQLLVSQLMAAPEPGHPSAGFGAWAYDAHEAVGLTVLGLLVLHWLWKFTGHVYGGMGRLFPWFSAIRRREIGEELKLLTARRFRDIPERGALAGAVHGLGLLAATAMAVTGGAIFLGMGENGGMSASIHVVREIHEFIANFMWAYLIGHAGMAVLHQWLGHRTLSDMFRLRN